MIAEKRRKHERGALGFRIRLSLPAPAAEPDIHDQGQNLPGVLPVRKRI
jgi:hypothetical protein